MQHWGQGAAKSFQTPAAPQIQPISSLSPFIGRWWIKARVIDKSPKRTWNNARGQGQLFSMTLVDENKDAIRATIFQEGVDKYYDMLQNEKVYIFSKGTVKNANKKFSTLANDYELSMDQNTEITEAPDDNTIVRQKFTFVPIASLANKEKNSNVDLCAVVAEVGEISTINTKAGDSLKKRVIQLVDASEAQVELTLWQDTAEKFDGHSLPTNTIVAAKNCRISDWSGISLSLGSQGSLTVDPDVEQKQVLEKWLASHGGQPTVSTQLTTKGGGGGPGFDERKTFSSLRDEGLGVRDDGKVWLVSLGVHQPGISASAPDYLSVRATVTHIRQENMWYTACPDCNKKVMQVTDGSGLYRCDKCEKNTDASFRYILSLTANDHSGSQWLTAFQDVAEPLMGIDAKSLAQEQVSGPSYLPSVPYSIAPIPASGEHAVPVLGGVAHTVGLLALPKSGMPATSNNHTPKHQKPTGAE